MKIIKKNQQLKKSVIIFLLFALLSAVMILKDYLEAGEEISRGILRDKQGSNPRTEYYIAETEDGFQGQIRIDILPKENSEEESMELLEQAKAEFEKIYLGENKSPDKVEKDLVMPETFMDGKVHVEYQISPSGFLDEDGEVNQEEISEQGQMVLLKSIFTCEDQAIEYEAALHLQPKNLTKQEKIQSAIEQEVKEQEEDSRYQQRFQLPNQIDGKKIAWKRSPDWDGVYFILAGAVAGICVWRREKEKERKQKRNREKELIKDYPHMVMQLSMLTGAGMSVFGSWERLVKGAEKNGEERIYIKEMKITYREIKDGCPEVQAYEKFGMRIGLLIYRKFASVLVQSMQKGSSNFKYLLEQEADSAWEERKNAAKKQGEETATKMLMPMMLMLLIVLIIIVVPAVTSF